MNQPIKLGGWLKGSANHPMAQIFDSVVKPGANATVSGQHIIRDGVPVFYQELSDCVANATCGAFQIVKYLQDPSKAIALSRNFLYYNARSYSGDTSQDSGCYIHLALQTCQRLGLCSEQTDPYSLKYQVKPSLKAYREADSSHIATYYQITSDGDQRIRDIALAVLDNHPVIFGTTVGQELMNYDGRTNKTFQYPSTHQVGGHAMCIIGVANDENNSGKLKFFVRNSWSTSWGLNGYYWIGEDYLKHPDSSDFFVPTMMEDILFG